MSEIGGGEPTRREFFRTLLRYGAFGALFIGGGFLMFRDGNGTSSDCPPGNCSGCPLTGRCTLEGASSRPGPSRGVSGEKK